MRGLQTATVVGPDGEEVHPDEHGRVKVQFHWDRSEPFDETSSCWVRVSQLWAGNGWGAMFIPRIGHEVLVDFIEGDPDRPVVTGRLYTGNNKPPYPLPAEKTKSTIKSESSLGGGGFNELRFEDLKGREEIFLHAAAGRRHRRARGASTCPRAGGSSWSWSRATGTSMSRKSTLREGRRLGVAGGRGGRAGQARRACWRSRPGTARCISRRGKIILDAE
jgi:uncharacterized protein involved in type VI secretion and phage assembly